jgi:hypothetical protein
MGGIGISCGGGRLHNQQICTLMEDDWSDGALFGPLKPTVLSSPEMPMLPLVFMNDLSILDLLNIPYPAGQLQRDVQEDLINDWIENLAKDCGFANLPIELSPYPPLERIEEEWMSPMLQKEQEWVVNQRKVRRPQPMGISGGDSEDNTDVQDVQDNVVVETREPSPVECQSSQSRKFRRISLMGFKGKQQSKQVYNDAPEIDFKDCQAHIINVNGKFVCGFCRRVHKRIGSLIRHMEFTCSAAVVVRSTPMRSRKSRKDGSQAVPGVDEVTSESSLTVDTVGSVSVRSKRSQSSKTSESKPPTFSDDDLFTEHFMRCMHSSSMLI